MWLCGVLEFQWASLSQAVAQQDVGDGGEFTTSEAPTWEPEKEEAKLWQILMDRSQLVMTIVGLIANAATCITLLKNGEVRLLCLSICLVGKVSIDRFAVRNKTEERGDETQKDRKLTVLSVIPSKV